MMSKDTLKEPPAPLTSGEDFIDYAMSHGFGDLHFKVDPVTGMTAIIAIHSTKLGPALGGCRFIEYNQIQDAIYDAMRLARGMSFKAASVNLPLGGGKAVIIKPKGAFDRKAYFNAFGQFVNELNGRYITALDSGTLLSDMEIIAAHTPYVASLTGRNGDPSPYTAHGIFQGIMEAVRFKLGKTHLRGVHVAIQGLGHVGYILARLLHEAGAKLTVADVSPERVQQAVREFGASFTDTTVIHKTACDVFSPCALGAVLNDQSIDELQTPIVAGAANNQLAHRYHGGILHDRGILYAPDYVINAGGLIYAANTYLQRPEATLNAQMDHIGQSLREIFERSSKDDLPASEIADALAQEKLQA